MTLLLDKTRPEYSICKSLIVINNWCKYMDRNQIREIRNFGTLSPLSYISETRVLSLSSPRPKTKTETENHQHTTKGI